MPERPKRRKNKNKRKNNKSSATDVNKNNIEELKNDAVEEPCSSVTQNISNDNALHITEENIDITTSLKLNDTSKESDATDVAKLSENTNDEKETISNTSTISSQIEKSNEELLLPSESCSISNEKREVNKENQDKQKNNNTLASSDVFCSSDKLSNNDINNKNKTVEDVIQTYIVETPDQVTTTKTKCKLDNAVKSKSCDNDDSPTIVEIVDESNGQSDHDNSLSVIDNSNIIISGEESDIEWENVNHFNIPQTQLIKGIMSSDTIPLNIVHCEQIKSLSPQEELSLRNYLKTLNLSTCPSNLDTGDIKTEIEEIINREIKYRLRKKGFTDETTLFRPGPSRSLAVIDEEGSGDSSKTSRRHSYLSDKKSDNEELEDDVFECKPICPVRNPDINVKFKKSDKRSIPQPCYRVDAKLKEPEISEARGDWSMKTIERLSGAELVYLTDSSSSTSSIYDLNDDAEKSEETDASVRIITPTIEVTDTESLLSNTFLSNNTDKQVISKSCENVCKASSANMTNTENDKTKGLDDKDLGLNLQNNSHEIIILSTDNIKTNLFVKDMNETQLAIEPEKINESGNISDKISTNSSKPLKNTDTYDLEIKVLKCELNNAINNLIKEVISDSENNKENLSETFTRQDSSSSLDSSQCTAKYNPTHSSLNDVTNILQDDSYDSKNKDIQEIEVISSHVKDVLECVNENLPLRNENIPYKDCKKPSKLRDICLKKISSFPFGDKILEELAHVSLRIQNMSALASERNQTVTTQPSNNDYLYVDQYEESKTLEHKKLLCHNSSNAPPPILPRKSSLKISQEDPLTKLVITRTEPKYECMSPSQKMLMEKTNTTIDRDFQSQPNINLEHSKSNEKKYIRSNILSSSPPMKSETGSRLLALLRDTSVSNNFKPQKLEDNTNTNYLLNKKFDSQTFSKRLIDEIDSTNFTKETQCNKKSVSSNFSTNNLKPLPPPKPTKLKTYFYESDEGSDFRENSFQTMRSSKKYFHYSTGNLSKEIEDDISSIQNMHRYCTNLRDQSYESSPRRPSLPKDLCDQQMEYIRQKEKEVDAELRRLEHEQNKSIRSRGPRAPMISDDNHISMKTKSNRNKDFMPISQTHKNTGNDKLSSLFSSSQEELLREKMYSEYVSQMAEREQRKQQKVIKVTQTPTNSNVTSKSMPLLDLDSKVNNRIEQEFISKARERWYKLGITDPETEDERDAPSDLYVEPKVIEHKIKVIDAGEEKDVKKLPSHMQEFVKFTVKDKGEQSGSTETVMIAPTFKARSTSPAIWRPGAPSGGDAPTAPSAPSPGAPPPPPPPPVWSPGSNTTSPQTPRKTFRPVHFEDTPPPRRKFESTDQNGCTSGSESESRLRTSHSAPVTGLNSLGASSRLPRAQNPTVTLLQKAREGQIPRAPSNIPPREENPRLPRDRPSPPRTEQVHVLRKDYASESEAERSDFERSTHRMTDTKKKIEGIGPTTKDGMPVTLRSEVKDPSKWYKKMYDTIHKNKYDEDYVTIRYKNRRGETLQRPSSNRSQYAYFDPRSGYLSEPEGGLSRLASSTWSDAYDSDVTSGPRRRTASVQEDRRHDEVPVYLPNNKYSTLASARARQEVYKTQPGRIENYVPGRSSVIDKEAKQWWDEVMDIFDGWLDENSPLPPYSTLLARAIQKSQNESNAMSQSQASPKEKKDFTSAILSKSNMARALKESGYESDSTLVFRRRDDTEAPLSPAERRAAYRDLQAGGEPPLRGFRSPAPPRQDESEIEYIPISSTLTKIRVHKKTPQMHEVICFPVTSLMKDNEDEEYMQYRRTLTDHPPIPPRRISSKNSRTLQLVTSRHSSPSTKTITLEKSNVGYLKDKISNKLSRENTHVILKKDQSQKRILSSSAPPALNRHKMISATANIKQKTPCNGKNIGTSSFSSPRRTILPINYPSTGRKQAEISSVVLEGGAGRKTPITNILDKITTLDKLWGSQKRNERIDISKIRPKSLLRQGEIPTRDTIVGYKPTNSKSIVPVVTHKSRDMIRTSERIQKLKIANIQAKSTPCLTKSETSSKSLKSNSLQVMSSMSKSSSQIAPILKKSNQVKTASVANLKKKKSLETITLKPRSIQYQEPSTKKIKDLSKTVKKGQKNKSISKKNQKDTPNEADNQFGDVLDDDSNRVKLFNKKDSKDIKKAHDAVVSDSFFQHLFLRKQFNSVMPLVEPDSMSSVLQKAKMFQSLPESNLSYPNSLNTYLIHRKPVSLSRFKMWDRQPSPLHVENSRSISWPGKMNGNIRKFDSLSKYDSEFGSASSLATVRSKSEPPANKLYFSQTSRPVSPTVIFHKKEEVARTTSPVKFKSPNKFVFLQSPPKSLKSSSSYFDKSINLRHKTISPTRVIFSEPVQSISPSEITDVSDKSRDKIHGTIFFSQTSRPVSPKVVNETSASRSKSTSPVSIRSPSYRRIYNARTQTKLESMKKEFRTQSADNVKKYDKINKISSRACSDSHLYKNDPDYDEYIREEKSLKRRSERFRELNRYYAYLERVAELEKETSSRNICYRKKDEEIIDFDRWKKIRTIERAEEELNNLYSKLKKAQNESDILFYPRDVNDFRWDYSRERGLRVKEKSVEDLKEELQQKTEDPEVDHFHCRDMYKPLWRGTSVAETAFTINTRNKIKDKRILNTDKPKSNPQSDSLTDLQKKIGLGNRLWSSLSMEQVSALKNQLNAIYSKEFEAKSNKENEKYTIDVKDTVSNKNPKLHVRCSSLVTPRTKEKETELNKSKSIAAISYPLASEKELKNNVNKMQMSLTENEKKKISQSLSKEVLNRINKFDTTALRQVSDNLAISIDDGENQAKITDVNTNTNTNAILPLEDKNRYLIYPAQNPEILNQSSASETETGSSDISGKTVIYNEPKKEVQKKVDYFESVKNEINKPKNIYRARDTSLEHKECHPVTDAKDTNAQKNQIFQSQSCTNIKDFFGESEKNKFLSLPLKSDLHSRSPSPRSEVYVSDRRTPDTLRFSSDETIWRSRSPSPDPERYWRTYLKLAREGEVRRLARRFDSPSAAGAVLRRYRSDPEIIRNDIKNIWPFGERATRRGKCRALLPVARMPLRPNNRFMPHIDVISKLAALRKRNTTRSHSAEEALECRPGEVERIRRRFEAMSLLGEIYTSAPDVRYLHDIESYLAGPWIAHRYPKPEDNYRSITDTTTLVRGRAVPDKKKNIKTQNKESVKINSILKNESLAKQAFNPLAHRPASRYEPPRTPPRPPPTSWPHRLAPYITPTRHTVTFQENDTAPEPPRRASRSSFSDSESPSRRYVESDVNIHYRCPVRHDPLPLVPERELAIQQAEHMKRLYREQRRNKYLQELQDMQNRRHQDNFMPSQKTVVPLNRYDEADKIVAKALYTFNGQTTRELSFRKGDIINVRKQIDSNWYEGEVHGKVGLFPYNYVELLKGEAVQTLKKPAVVEGRARAKFDFIAQTNLELPLKKGEIVVLSRRIDHNWWEGRNASRTGIFPDSYITILQEPSPSKPESQPITTGDKPAASPAAHGLLNGTDKRSMGSHSYTPQPNSPALSNAPPATQPLSGYVTKSSQRASAAERGYGPPTGAGVDLNNTEPLYVDTNAEAVPYRAMYKYRPQNPDELELNEGDTVYVLEKCDDGWYVGSSQRTGRFGTFPGNYVERI
ncbi:uncharacterized protein LOC112054660 isoform X4 [Bicyclus anynana]|uniref:Uncharacterized protein LOC112054660 isoform X4 n=1 Tax=Bicyclus anynana TaxID=110368 RepID=A0ABM3LP16_BICAN|nr:uncharacterized protein LOC112054660 isoform X4 [Bicyclus anynana]